MRFYPTDLLLTIAHAEDVLATPGRSALQDLLDQEGLTALAGLLQAAELAEGLDELFGGLSQYPWQHLIDSNDVCEFSPVGTVVIDDRRAGNSLRGLLLGWATGNQMLLRTARPAFWHRLVELLRLPGVPLPATTTAAEHAPTVDVVPADVPDVVLVFPDDVAVHATSEWADETLYSWARPGEVNAISVHVDPHRTDPHAFAGRLLALDCRSPWIQRLFHRSYLVGTTLAAARNRDVAEERGRVDSKLRYVVQQARRAPYYRDLPSVRSRADLGNLPILEKTSLDGHSLPTSQDFCSGATPSGEVLRSGATSGMPRYVRYSRTDWANMVREAIPIFYALGLAEGDRVINTLFGGRLYGGMVTTVCELSRMPLECYTTGQLVSVEDLLTLVQSFSANAVIGQPALILPLLRDAKARAPELRVEKIIYGGTPMTESDKAWLREELGAKVVSSILAANDGAQLGYQCAKLGESLHHLIPDYNLIEVVDDDGNPVPRGKAGHLLVTTLQKFEGPLIRYRIGDRGRVLHHDCGCGISGDVLEYLGRSDQQIKIMARRMLYSELLDALEPFKVSQLQAEVLSNCRSERLVLRTESRLHLDAEEVRQYLIRKVDALGDVDVLPADLEVFELVVECHPEGALPRNLVSGKIVPVLDRRLG